MSMVSLLQRTGFGVALALVAAFLTTGAASAATVVPSDASPCKVRTQEQRTDGDYIEYRVVASCDLPPHTEVRGVLPFSGEPDRHTSWFSRPGEEFASDWYSGALGSPGEARLETRPLEGSYSGVACLRDVEVKQMPWYLPNQHRVAMTCHAIPDNIEVRGVLEVNVGDQYTDWIRSDKVGQTVYSPYSSWGISPGTRVEWRYLN